VTIEAMNQRWDAFLDELRAEGAAAGEIGGRALAVAGAMAAVSGMTEDQFLRRAYNVFARAQLEWKPEATT